MKIQEQIEKVYRVKGYDDFFHSNAEARKFVREKVAKAYKDEIIRKQELIRDYKTELENIEQLEKEMTVFNKRFAEHWTISDYSGGQVLQSRGTAPNVKIPFALDLDTKKDVAFAKEIIRNYCRRARIVFGKKIRKYKDEIKQAQKKCNEFTGGEK